MKFCRLVAMFAGFGVAAAVHAAVAPVLVIHGGAGVIRRDMGAAKEKAVRAALTLALQRGYAELKAGKSSVDAVAAALTVLEDDPHFNAGRAPCSRTTAATSWMPRSWTVPACAPVRWPACTG